MRESSILLNALLDKYENSKTFTGNNKVSQKIYLKPEKLFPDYCDDSNYDIFEKVNAAVNELEKEGLIYTERLKNGIVQKVILNQSKLLEAYKVCKRSSKKEIHKQLFDIWENIADKTDVNEEPLFYRLFSSYVDKQKERINQNRQIEYFDDSISDYQDLFKAIREIVNNDQEQFIRDFSVKLFVDSKRLEQLEDKIRAVLYEYGESSNRETALEEYGIVKTPTYVSVKGKAILDIGGQKLDLSKFKGDISFSTITLEQIDHIVITCNNVVTIENLTSFHTFSCTDSLVVYLGGYHNNAKRQFLKKIYENNQDKAYFHFGDIDAGGFYIYEHLVSKTGILFQLLGMDITTLSEHRNAWKELSLNDRTRIKTLIKKKSSEGYRDVLTYMLENNCKLEQEAVNIVI